MFSESLILDSLAIYKHFFTLYFPISHKIEKHGIWSKSILGHSFLAMTMVLYRHMLPDTKAVEMEKIAEAF